MKFLKRKKVVVPLAIVAVLALTGGAIAYWTASGSGSGNATVGTSSALTVTAVSFGGPLYPGSSTPVTFSVNNPGSAPIHVTSITSGGISTTGSCLSSDFSFTNGTTLPADIPAGGSLAGTGTLAMANTALNQDACKSTSVGLTINAA